ncbi:isoprenyl transferase [Clostridium sp. CAG:798]|jgi:undecaprenyl diphosphate synthase|nr:isoprenyl transferase [Clostridium sp. CAG:798]
MENNLPEHIAIIMDGNRRWAKEKNLEVKQGHYAGAENLEKIAQYANKIGIKYMTVYAFSTENWKRSENEVKALMMILKNYIEKLLERTSANNIKINILGDISRLEIGLQNSINKIIDKTKNNTGLTLNIAFNYGGRAEILRATKQIAEEVHEGKLDLEKIDEKCIENHLYTKGQPDPDILIRTSGEIRISNFLLWQLAYTEFIFIDKYWPDFNENDIEESIHIFQKRHRKFGAN